MISINVAANIAAQIGNPCRFVMLSQLLDGRALTASELARASGVAPQTASEHLARLVEAGLLTVNNRGRFRYFTLSSAHVAELMQALFQVGLAAGAGLPKVVHTGPKDAALRELRICYDHLAGRLAVAITDALLIQGFVELSTDGGLLTETGRVYFEDLGVNLASLGGPTNKSQTLVCRPCLDWSERRPHLAGRLGAAFCQHCLDAGWIRRKSGTRALDITPSGHAVFEGIAKPDRSAAAETDGFSTIRDLRSAVPSSVTAAE